MYKNKIACTLLTPIALALFSCALAIVRVSLVAPCASVTRVPMELLCHCPYILSPCLR